MSKEIDPYALRYWIAYAAYLSLSNLIWEAAQLPLYTLWDQEFDTIVFSVFHCTGGDVLIGLFSLGIAYGLVRLTCRLRLKLAVRPRSVAFCAVLFGFGYTVFSEWLNVYVRKSWAYSDLMPLINVGDFGIGLSPMVQWLVLPTAFFIWKGRVRFKR
jgi:hypothetical protein